MEIGSSPSPAPSAPSAPSAPAAPASKPETPPISSAPSTRDSASISSEARTPSSSSSGIGNLTSGLESNFRSDVAKDFKTVAGVTKKGALAADGVEGAAHGSHHLHEKGIHAHGNTGRVAGALDKIAPAAKVAAPVLTAAAGTYEAASALTDPKLSAGEKTNKVAEAATCSAAAWAGGDLGAKGGAALGLAVAGPPGALVGGAVGGVGGAYFANKACRTAWSAANDANTPTQ